MEPQKQKFDLRQKIAFGAALAFILSMIIFGAVLYKKIGTDVQEQFQQERIKKGEM